MDEKEANIYETLKKNLEPDPDECSYVNKNNLRQYLVTLL
jgi:hypothetical protein